MCHGSSDLLPKLNIQYLSVYSGHGTKRRRMVCLVLIMHAQCRFNEGVTDILAKSIVMVGAPREVFAEYKLSHVPTM